MCIENWNAQFRLIWTVFQFGWNCIFRVSEITPISSKFILYTMDCFKLVSSLQWPQVLGWTEKVQTREAFGQRWKLYRIETYNSRLCWSKILSQGAIGRNGIVLIFDIDDSKIRISSKSGWWHLTWDRKCSKWWTILCPFFVQSSC